jgi:hypothetical protein
MNGGDAGAPVITLGAGVTPGHPALWSKKLGTGGVGGLAFDPSGNLIVAGSVGPEAQRSPGFVGAFDRNGDVNWQDQWSSGNPSFGTAVAVGGGSVWVLGLSIGKSADVVDLGGGMISTPAPLPSPSPASGFLVRYDSMGAFVTASLSSASWIGFDASGFFSLTVAAAAGTPDGFVFTKTAADGTMISTPPVQYIDGAPALNTAGNIAFFGDFGVRPVDAGPLAGGFGVMTLGGHTLWSRTIFYSAKLVNYHGDALALDSAGNLVVAGWFSGELDLGCPEPLVGPTAAGSDPGEPIFLAKYDREGNCLWNHVYGSTLRAQSRVSAISIVQSGDIFLTGSFAGQIDFGTGAMQTTTDPMGVGVRDPFLARLHSDGTAVWSEGFAGPFYGVSTQIAIAADGRVGMAVSTAGTIDFGNGPLTGGDDSPQFGYFDGFIAVFDP